MNDNIFITQSKSNANGNRYANLFLKHIPQFDPGAKILLMSIGNEECITCLMAKNPTAEYVIYDNELVCKGLKILNSLCKISYIYDDNPFENTYNIDMTFDCIIMNPPYKKNLHLKILAEAIKHLKDEKSVCVNLSPIRWLQDPISRIKNKGDYKRFNTSICKHLNFIDVVTAQIAQQCFYGTVMNMDLGIYSCASSANSTFDYNALSKNKILSKCEDYIVSHNPILDENKQDGWRVRMPLILGGKTGGSGDRKIGLLSFGKLLNFKDGKYKDGRWWYECYVKNQYSKTTPYITSSIHFNSENESLNFISQFNTNFTKYITNVLVSDVHVTPEIVLWMGDAINPRTGKKGYEGEWLDKDFYTFFNITSEEQKVIEETMEKYK